MYFSEYFFVRKALDLAVSETYIYMAVARSFQPRPNLPRLNRGAFLYSGIYIQIENSSELRTKYFLKKQ